MPSNLAHVLSGLARGGGSIDCLGCTLGCGVGVFLLFANELTLSVVRGFPTDGGRTAVSHGEGGRGETPVLQ